MSSVATPAPAVKPRRRLSLILTRLALLALTLLLLAYFAIGALVANTLTVPVRKPLVGNPQASLGLPYEDVSLTARDGTAQLSAWYIPAPGSQRAIIFVHGKDGCRTCEFKGRALEFAGAMHGRGFSMFMLDLRGHGQSGEGRFTFGLRERYDIEAAVDWLKTKGYQPGQIGLMGASMGAASSILATANDPDIGALVADSSYADIYSILEVEFPKASRLPAFFLPATTLMGRFIIGEDIGSSRPVDAIDDIGPRPVLLIHASGDQLIPQAHAERLAAADPQAQLWVINGPAHVSTYPVEPQAYVTRVADFFNNSLR
ncbi:MAG: alpha/beta fold hydrolase [Chloroflexaceae bacterium]|jgi:pimeloyl-ACP methyl ester carboxylesterase|nr:alpha/beta fold hydrolase [Chloroflexaceae bacterium]